MNKITSGVVKGWAKDLGADIVGIASVERFEGAPPGHGPRDLVPEAGSVIVAGIRIPDPIVDYDRYHLKFQEEPQSLVVKASVENLFMLMGHYTIDIMLNILAIRIANRLEVDWGYKSFPTPNTVKTGLGHPVYGLARAYFSQRHAATRAGLGEFGFNNIVLTPQFGPRVRFVSIITEAELEPDPLIAEKICLREKCGGRNGPKCLQVCTPHAIQLREGVDPDAIFIDTPSKTEVSLCVERVDDISTHSCVYVGTCVRVCPIKTRLRKGKSADQ